MPRSVAMAMVGQKTEEVYRQYAIVDEAMIREAADQDEPRCEGSADDFTTSAQPDQPWPIAGSRRTRVPFRLGESHEVTVLKADRSKVLGTLGHKL